MDPDQPPAGAINQIAGQTNQIDQTDMTNRYNTPLDEKSEAKFQQWAKSSERDLTRDLPVYDMRGFWKDNGEQADNGHFPDTYKKPSHPTFSVESKYNGLDGHVGGTWETIHGRDAFAPGPTNLAIHGEKGIMDYLSRSDPNVILKFVEQRP